MQLFNSIEAFPHKSGQELILALGFFDGLHLGHQKILKRVKESAGSEKGSAVFTFENHPQTILNPAAAPPAMITSPEQKRALLEKAGIGICFSVPFTEAFSKMDAEVFVKDVLLKQLQVKKICLGYNAHFGQGRKGNPEFMRELAPKLGFEFEEIGPVNVNGEPVSSSRIRKLIQAGDMALAAECLGRPYAILGRVVKGDGRGSQIGFPTANLETQASLLPPEGVYPVQVREQGKDVLHPGVLNYGRRPTFKKGEVQPVLEVFLLDYRGDLYGTALEVHFHPRIREERVFNGVDALKAQIAKDVEASRRYFAHPKAG